MTPSTVVDAMPFTSGQERHTPKKVHGDAEDLSHPMCHARINFVTNAGETQWLAVVREVFDKMVLNAHAG